MEHHDIQSGPWALSADRIIAIDALLKLDSGDARPAPVPAPTTIRGIAVLPLFGVLMPNASALGEQLGLLGLKRFTQSFRLAVADDSVSGILLDIDSPGGSVFGVAEFAEEVYRARGRKPVFAIANSLAASAAYWIGSSASEFYASPGSDVGSIGVFAMHQNRAKAFTKAGVNTTLIHAGKYKVEGSPFAPLSDEAKAYMQTRIESQEAGTDMTWRTGGRHGVRVHVVRRASVKTAKPATGACRALPGRGRGCKSL
jgi:signal peptide peptidase SppA